jgi:hypothetical protein
MNNLLNTFLSNASKSLKTLWLILIITIFLTNTFTNTAFADGSQPPTPDTNPLNTNWKTVPTDPNRVLSPAEKNLRAAKYSALQKFMHPTGVSIFGSIPSSSTLVVGTWKEPNDDAHVNYCGPGATEVALDARWPLAKVTAIGINKIGVAEKTNVGKPGTAMQDIYTTINSKAYLGSEFPNPNGMQGYWLDLALDQMDLFWKASFDITHGYTLITALNTKGMPGWNPNKGVPHIVSVIGYNISQTHVISITYVETSGSAAGFHGSYRNTVSIANFFTYVLGLNTLVW